MVAKKAVPQNTYTVIGVVLAEVEVEIKAADFAEAGALAEKLVVGDFISFEGREVSSNPPELRSIALEG